MRGIMRGSEDSGSELSNRNTFIAWLEFSLSIHDNDRRFLDSTNVEYL